MFTSSPRGKKEGGINISSDRAKVQLELFTIKASGITESILNILNGFEVDNACGKKNHK